MDAQKVDMFLMANGKFFESHLIPQIHDMLLRVDDSKYLMIQTISFKDPTTILIVSLLAGHFGIDRFLIGDTGIGVGKLLTCGGLGVWTLVDFFLIMGRTREVNFQKLQMMLY
jgi:TM2 domain-containing membrane protein YozV